MSTIVISSLVGFSLFAAGVFLGYHKGDNAGFVRGYFLRETVEAERRDKLGRFKST